MPIYRHKPFFIYFPVDGNNSHGNNNAMMKVLNGKL